MKKVINPIYGEALLIVSIDYKIDLYPNRYITNFKD